MNYTVTFTHHYCYDVEANNNDEAYNKAVVQFVSDMRQSIACTCFDEVSVECNDDLEDKEDE